MAEQVHVPWIVSPFAFVLSISIAGIASAWLSGSARIPFVAGPISTCREGLGRLHQKYATPYVALIVHASFSAIFLGMSFVGAGVKEAFVTMLDLAVVLPARAVSLHARGVAKACQTIGARRGALQ